MSWQHVYVDEKLRELREADLNSRSERPQPPRKPKPVIGPVAKKTGQALRRLGENLEAWGASAPPEGARGMAAPALPAGRDGRR